MAHGYSQETFLLGTGQPARALGHPDLVIRSLSLRDGLFKPANAYSPVSL